MWNTPITKQNLDKLVSIVFKTFWYNVTIIPRIYDWKYTIKTSYGSVVFMVKHEATFEEALNILITHAEHLQVQYHNYVNQQRI